MTRKYKLSKMYGFINVGDSRILVPVFEDLSDEDLKTQFKYYLEREDFEYVEEVIAEARLRGIKLKVNN